MLHAPVNPQQWNRCAWQLRKVGSYNYSAFIVADFTWIDANVLSFIWHHWKEKDIQCIYNVMFVYENNRNWGWYFFSSGSYLVLDVSIQLWYMCRCNIPVYVWHIFRNGSFSCFVDPLPLVALQCVLNIHCAHMNSWYKGNLCQI